MPLENSCLPRFVRIGDNLYRMDPPTVGQAIELFYVSRELDPENEVERQVLEDLIVDMPWKGVSAKTKIKSFFRADPAEVLDIVVRAIRGKFDPSDLERRLGTQEDGGRQEDASSPPNWRFLLSQTCSLYNLDPHRVWTEWPFTFFMEFVAESHGQKYRNRIEDVRRMGAGFGGVDEDTMKEWSKIASPSQPDEDGEPKRTQKQDVDPKQERQRLRSQFGIDR